MQSVKFDEKTLSEVMPILKKMSELKLNLVNYLKGVMDGKGLEGYSIDLQGLQFIPPKEKKDDKPSKKRS